MNFDLVSRCAPKEFLCPYCGDWHPWTGFKLNQHYMDQYSSRNVEKCPHVPQSEIYFWMEETDKKIIISVRSPCDKISSGSLSRETPQRQFIEDEKEPIVYTYFTFTSNGIINEERCSYCGGYCSKTCQYRKMGAGTDYRRIFPVKLGFKFSEEDYKKYSDVGKAGKFVES